QDTARRRDLEPVAETEQRRLARTRRSDERHDTPAGDRAVGPVETGTVRPVDGYPLEAEESGVGVDVGIFAPGDGRDGQKVRPRTISALIGAAASETTSPIWSEVRKRSRCATW